MRKNAQLWETWETEGVNQLHWTNTAVWVLGHEGQWGRFSLILILALCTHFFYSAGPVECCHPEFVAILDFFHVSLPCRYIDIIDQAQGAAQGQNGWKLARFSFWVFMDRDEVEVYTKRKKRTSLVNKGFIIGHKEHWKNDLRTCLFSSTEREASCMPKWCRVLVFSLSRCIPTEK